MRRLLISFYVAIVFLAIAAGNRVVSAGEPDSRDFAGVGNTNDPYYRARLGVPTAYLADPVPSEHLPGGQVVTFAPQTPQSPIRRANEKTKQNNPGSEKLDQTTNASNEQSKSPSFPNAKLTGLLQMDGAFLALPFLSARNEAL